MSSASQQVSIPCFAILQRELTPCYLKSSFNPTLPPANLINKNNRQSLWKPTPPWDLIQRPPHPPYGSIKCAKSNDHDCADILPTHSSIPPYSFPFRGVFFWQILPYHHFKVLIYFQRETFQRERPLLIICLHGMPPSSPTWTSWWQHHRHHHPMISSTYCRVGLNIREMPMWWKYKRVDFSRCQNTLCPLRTVPPPKLTFVDDT